MNIKCTKDLLTLSFLTTCCLIFYNLHIYGQQTIELEEVVVTGTRTERLITESPIQTELYKSEDFSNLNFSSVKEVLALVPSARFENDCQNCGLNQVQLLGLNQEYTALLFDGAPLYSGLAKVYGADLFPSIFVDRIEVVKGGGSVLYGPEAIAGVVNLITDEPKYTNGKIKFSAEHFDVGEEQELEQSFIYDYVDSHQKYAISLYGMAMDRGAMDLGSDGYTEIPEFNNQILGSSLWYHPIEETEIKATYQFLNSDHRGGNKLDLSPEAADIAESLAHEIHTLGLTWEQQVSEDFYFSLFGSLSSVNRDSFYGSRSANAQTAFTDAGNPGSVTDHWIASNESLVTGTARKIWGQADNQVYYVDSQFNHVFDKHTVSYGAQYRFEVMKDATPYNPFSPTSKDSVANLGLYLQNQWTISPNFELVPGIRIDNNNNVGNVIFSPRLAAKFNLTDQTMIRSSYSTGFNAPGVFNEDQHITVTNEGSIDLVNDPNLKEESSQTFSFGIENRPSAMNGYVVLLSQIHYTQVRDTFDIDDSNSTIWIRENGPDSNIFVWENSLSWQINDHWKLDTNLSYISSKFDRSVNRVSGFSTNQYLKTPEWTGGFILNYNNHDRIDAYLSTNFTGSMIAVAEDADFVNKDTPDFWEIDLGLSKEFPGLIGNMDLKLLGGLKNLLDQRQKDFQENGADRDVTYFYGPSRPRSFYFAAELLF